MYICKLSSLTSHPGLVLMDVRPKPGMTEEEHQASGIPLHMARKDAEALFEILRVRLAPYVDGEVTSSEVVP